MTDLERMQSFPDQSHWSDFTIDGRAITEAEHYTVSYWDTDQGKARVEITRNE